MLELLFRSPYVFASELPCNIWNDIFNAENKVLLQNYNISLDARKHMYQEKQF